jgi:hypothetical protein
MVVVVVEVEGRWWWRQKSYERWKTRNVPSQVKTKETNFIFTNRGKGRHTQNESVAHHKPSLGKAKNSERCSAATTSLNDPFSSSSWIRSVGRGYFNPQIAHKAANSTHLLLPLQQILNFVALQNADLKNASSYKHIKRHMWTVTRHT